MSGDPAATPGVDALIADLTRIFAPRPLVRDGRAVYDMTLGQIRLLDHLDRAGPLSMGAVARFADCSLQSASALVDRLERRGLAERRHRSDDRRVVECRLTEAGRDLVRQFAGQRTEALRAALSVLDPGELTELHRLVRLIGERRA